MKYLISLINCILTGIIIVFVATNIKIDSKIIDTTLDVKKINSLKLNTKEEIKVPSKMVQEEQEIKKEEIPSKEKREEVSKEESKIEEPIKEEIPEKDSTDDKVESFTGSMSGYGSDCRGCIGYTSSGYNIKNTIYYKDSEYGQVRILAGDSTFRFGSIIRVKGSKIDDFIGIVLDRGSAVGIGKKHLFDLLFSSEQEARFYEVSYNVTFEVLRNGY